MNYLFYPGCTLKNRANILEEKALKSASILDTPLKELPEWQCCGAVYPLARDEIVTIMGGARALIDARDRNSKLITLCSACHHVLKRTNWAFRNKEDVRKKANNYLKPDEDYRGETEVLHYLEFLQQEISMDKIKEKINNSLAGKKVGAYYGCLLLRPAEEMNFDDPEQPTIIEDLIDALGGESVFYPYRTECCGGYLNLKNKSAAERMRKKIIASARDHGIDELTTACPLCYYNLQKEVKNDKDINVSYISELLFTALADSEEVKYACK